ncbi:helix-turn-helix domain-containing protein [Mycobacterium intracellulare]|uniref:HTH cro/C1-type domain-containing protein n=1 Tax=Mycobacterium intracellulare subsp. chimaera TaxID=222805 RepID=A0A7U5RY78_MYCIT|nr:helix-turn-helix transcriptional regulator [Mycobacterium intracellulare]ASL18298.1 hypothetical protein MYCOZU2_05953 [Mycobacterium intracellulare subsp. chimaera]
MVRGPRRRRRRDISAGDLVPYGSVANREVRVDLAAMRLRTSKTAVREAIRDAAARLRNVFYRAISGLPEADVGELTNIKGMLQAAYGKGPRGGEVDANKAGEALGVSPATIRRWARGTQQPSADHLKALKSAARKAATTKAGRRRATASFRASERGRKALDKGATIHISGYQAPSGYEHERDRVCSQRLTGQEIEDLLRAYEEGGERGLCDWLTGIMDRKYLGDWTFGTIEDFRIGDIL